MYNFNKYREQYRSNLQLAIPVILSQLGQILVQFADNAMVGKYGGDDPLPLAAAAFGGGLYFVSFVTVMGLTFGITPIIGELFTQERHKEASQVLQNSLLLFFAIALGISAIQFAVIPMMWHMGQPEEVVALSIPYYRSLVWGMIPMIIFFVFKQFLEGMGNTKVAMFAVIASNLINIMLNYMLIGGELGAPEMGVLGAGIATLISRILLAVTIIIFFMVSRRMRPYRENFSWSSISKPAIKRLVDMGLPISLQIFLEVSSFVLIGFLFGVFGAAAISANQIGITIGNCAFMIIIAISSATTIRISHCYGRHSFDEMKLAAKAGWHLGLLWNFIAAVAFFALRNQIPHLFTSNEETIRLTSVLILMVVAYQIPDGIQCVGIGIMRGVQSVRSIPIISLVSYWLCTVPIAYGCAHWLGMGEVGLYMGYIVGLSLAAVLVIRRIRIRFREIDQVGK